MEQEHGKKEETEPVREKLPAHLPREIEIVDLPEEAKPCPCCGGARHVIGEAVSEKLDYVPATLKGIETRRPKYACRPCEGSVTVAPLPASPRDHRGDEAVPTTGGARDLATFLEAYDGHAPVAVRRRHHGHRLVAGSRKSGDYPWLRRG
jgi:hypothetical protein